MTSRYIYRICRYAIGFGSSDLVLKEEKSSFDEALKSLCNNKTLMTFTGTTIPENTGQYIYNDILLSIYKGQDKYIMSMILKSGVMYVNEISKIFISY